MALLSLIASPLVFTKGTALARNRLLDQQIRADADRVVDTLNQRAETISAAAFLLARDSHVVEVIHDQSEAASGMLDSSATVLRDRFDLDFVQIYDRYGQARTSLMPAGLDREPSLLSMAESGAPVARVVGDRLLLLSLVPVSEGAGTVLVGIDLETELSRILTRDRLAADLGLTLRGVHASTRPDMPFDAPVGWVDGQYSRRLPVMLGSTPAELLLLRSTSDIERITHAGLLVAVGSTLFTALSLSGLNMIVIWSIRRPIHRLAGAARAVAQGELDQEVQLAHHPLAVGEGDEIGLLAESLNQITADLRDLHANLEAKVQARTAAATTEAEIARVISSSLESDVILRRSAALIKKRLELHHVGIFLVESGSDTVVLEVTSSQGSEAAPVPECSRREKVQVPLGSKSPVGLAAATGRPQVIQDVRLQPTHLKPPLLIDTHSATAIPLLIGESQVGVLDLQSKQPGTFTPEVIHLLSRLADQIAAGVSNARLYAQQCRAAAHLAEVDRLRTQFLVVVSQRLRLLLCALSRVSEAVPIAGNDGPLTGELKRDLQVVLDSCHQLLTLIDDISDSSQIYADKIAQTLDDVDVVRVRLDSVEAGEGAHADRIR